MPFENDDLLTRVRRLEQMAIDAGMLKKVGEDIRDGFWESERRGMRIFWIVTFDYRCPKCNVLHDAKIEVPANSQDGLSYSVI